MPGYLPESDPVTFETCEEARSYTADELNRAADRCYEIDSGDGEMEGHATEYELAAEQLALSTDNDNGYWETFEDGRIAYWFQAVDLPDNEARAALNGEDY